MPNILVKVVVNFALAISTMSLGAVCAQEEEKREGLIIRPGLYDVTITQTRGAYISSRNESVEQPPETQAGQACFQPPGELVKAEHFNRPGCEINVNSIELSGIYYDMNCRLSGRDMRGRFILQSGRLLNGFKTIDQSDIFTLPDGRVAAQNFAATGSLNAQEGAVQAWMRTETQYTYAGECPS